MTWQFVWKMHAHTCSSRCKERSRAYTPAGETRPGWFMNTVLKRWGCWPHWSIKNATWNHFGIGGAIIKENVRPEYTSAKSAGGRHWHVDELRGIGLSDRRQTHSLTDHRLCHKNHWCVSDVNLYSTVRWQTDSDPVWARLGKKYVFAGAISRVTKKDVLVKILCFASSLTNSILLCVCVCDYLNLNLFNMCQKMKRQVRLLQGEAELSQACQSESNWREFGSNMCGDYMP